MMQNSLRFRFFEGLRSPAVLVTVVPLLIIGTSRLAFAVVSALAFVWTMCASLAITYLARKVFPAALFGRLLPLSLYTFIAGLFQFALELFNPVLAQEVILMVMFAPVILFASGAADRASELSFKAALGTAVFESVSAGIIITGFALMREPLGYGALTLPGGARGIFELFSFEDFAFPAQIISASPGALLLLGYLFLIFRLIKSGRKGGAA